MPNALDMRLRVITGVPKYTDNHFRRRVYGCTSCEEFIAVGTTASECGKCSNREMFTFNGETNCALKECPDGKVLDEYSYKPRS